MKKLSAVLMTLIFAVALSACTADDVAEFKSFVAGLDEEKTASALNDLQGGIPTGHYSVPDNASQASTPDTTFAVSQGSESVVLPDDIIQKGKAIEIALSHAGLSEKDVYDLEIEIDHEPNGTFWEIDFKSAGFEYDYEINAVTKEIVKSHKERD